MDPRLMEIEIERQAEVLHKALSGLGTKEQDIIDILARQSTERRQDISATYRALYKTELLDDIKKDTSGDFRRILKALCRTPEVNDAKTLHHALKGLGTDKKPILEVLCTRTNAELNQISNAYFSLFRATLISDLKDDTSGDFLQVLLGLLSGIRDESGNIDYFTTINDTEALIKAGPKTWGTEVAIFNGIFLTRSYPQLREIFREFEKMTGSDMKMTIKAEMSGDLAYSYLTLVKLIQNKEEYFAERLVKAVKGHGTDDDTLIRIFVSRMEKDLKGIDKAFQKLVGKPLIAIINEETTSDYKATLAAILENYA